MHNKLAFFAAFCPQKHKMIGLFFDSFSVFSQKHPESIKFLDMIGGFRLGKSNGVKIAAIGFVFL